MNNKGKNMYLWSSNEQEYRGREKGCVIITVLMQLFF